LVQALQKLGAEATIEAQTELQKRSLRDMKWLSNARGRVLKEMQADAKAKHDAVKVEVSAEVRAQPIYSPHSIEAALRPSLADVLLPLELWQQGRAAHIV
jgi:hypothetical protein